jgi:hypothetical protein
VAGVPGTTVDGISSGATHRSSEEKENTILYPVCGNVFLLRTETGMTFEV